MQHGIAPIEDLDIFFNTDEFAIDAFIRIMSLGEGQSLVSVRGIFETPYLKRDFGAFVVDADSPSFTCKWHDEFVNVRKGDDLYFFDDGTTVNFYIDSTPQNDGTGVVAFILTAADTQDTEGDELDDTIDEEPPTGGLFSPNPAAS